jgi:transcriptional regulator with XRE-family HTH domain
MSRKKTLISDLNLNTIGGRIAFIRVSNDLTQAQFSEKTGLSKGNISGLESNKYEPSARAIIKLVELFEISADWVLFGDKATEPVKSTEKENDNSKVTRVVFEHRDLIKRFKNPERVLCWNQRLIDIEDAGEELCDKVDNYLKGAHDAAIAIKKSKKKVPKKPSSTKKRRANGK